MSDTLVPAPRAARVSVGALCCIGCAAAACGTDTARVRIVDRARADGSYTTRDVVLVTLEDLDEVRGSATAVFGAATLRLGNLDAVRDRGSNRESFIRHAAPAKARWIVAGDVAVATDFDSLAMFTTYALVERSAESFRELGVVAAETPVPTFYAPRLVGATSLPSRDAAFYQNGLDLFVVSPEARGDRLPTGLNAGVVAHEYTHRVWYYELWNGSLMAMLPDLLADPEGRRAYNLLRGASEGVADYFGARAARASDFVSHSVPDDGGGRDLEIEKVVAPEWVSGDAPTTLGSYDPYALGSVLAAVLWRIDAAPTATALPGALVTAMEETGESVRRTRRYQLGDFERVLANALPVGARADACAALQRPYAIVWDRFAPVCP